MKGLWNLMKSFGRGFLVVRPYVPKSIVGLFVITQFFMSFFSKGFTEAFKELSLTLLVAEKTINDAVNLAIDNSPEYTLFSVLAIISSLMIIWYFVKIFGKLFIKVSGSQAEWGAYGMAFLFFVVVEVSAVRVSSGSFDFIPLWDGVLFLVRNFDPVLMNINWIPWF